MKNKVFNTTFENMLRILLLMGVLNAPANSDRLTALDFICIYGNKCKVLDSNLNKREKIAEAIKLAVKNAYVDVEQGQDGFVYSLNDRGEKIIAAIQSPYVKSYMLGAKIITRKFARTSDEDILKYISKMATESKEA